LDEHIRSLIQIHSTKAKQLECFLKVLNDTEFKENGNVEKWGSLVSGIKENKISKHIPLKERKKEDPIYVQLENKKRKNKK
jgi:hypothetical protein